MTRVRSKLTRLRRLRSNLKPMALVSFDAALASPGLRLVLLSGVPSPWSQAALAILRYKQLAFVHTSSRPVDPAFRRWNGARNLPAMLWGDEPVRTGWAEILALAERLAPEPRLIPRWVWFKALGDGAPLACGVSALRWRV